jgi:hypothetical protein
MPVKNLVSFLLFLRIESICVQANKFCDIFFDSSVISLYQKVCQNLLILSLKFKAHQSY